MRTKYLIQALLDGAYISQRQCRRKGFNYALYKASGTPVAKISDVRFRKFKDLFKVKHGRYTFNLNLVRQMHGKSLPKILYKQSKLKTDAAS